MSAACNHDLDISPSGHMAMCKRCGFVARWRDGAWERVEPATAPPPALDGKAFEYRHVVESDIGPHYEIVRADDQALVAVTFLGTFAFLVCDAMNWYTSGERRIPTVEAAPFHVAEYVCLPGDRIGYHAIEQCVGICTPGRNSQDLAVQDAQALNAAYTLGKNAGREERDAAIHAAYEQVRMTAIPGGSGHLLVPDTAIGALRSALYPKGGVA